MGKKPINKPFVFVILTALVIGTYLYFKKPKQLEPQDKIYQDSIKRILDSKGLYSGVGKKDHDEALLVEYQNGIFDSNEFNLLVSQSTKLDSNLLYRYFMFLRTRYGYVNP